VSVVFVTKNEKRLRRTVLSLVACPALPYFSTLSHKRHDFGGGGNLFGHKMCVLFFFPKKKRGCPGRYCPGWPARLCHFSPHFHKKGTILGGGGKLIGHKMCVLIFSTIFV